MGGVQKSPITTLNDHPSLLIFAKFDPFEVRLATCAPNTLFTDEAHDLAVFRVDDLILPPLSIGDSSKLLSGQWVAAMGNPLSYRGMFSVGVLSQFYPGNALVQDSVMFFSLSTDRGSSGGPILNMQGEVVGVVVGGYLYREMFTFGIPTKFVVHLILFAQNSLNTATTQR